MTSLDPSLDVERSFFGAGARSLIACDEVGRGALAGPVAVGMVVVDESLPPVPAGLRDSKLLSEAKRELIAPECRAWVRWSAVGLASAHEIDEFGIMAALGRAGARALAILHALGADVGASVVLLDGNYDWLNPSLRAPLPVTTRVKADLECASVAAASVIAKVHRDTLMVDRHAMSPGYGWAANKGYGSAAHLAAIRELGPSDFHRLTWLKGASGIAQEAAKPA